MTGNQSRGPVFIHASPRSGSTYFFNVLRRLDPLLCFDEAIDDSFTYYTRNSFARRVARGQWNWSHSFLERYSQAEFLGAWNSAMRLFPPVPVFRDYIPLDGILPEELRRYLAALIGYANEIGKRPALCEIYSRGRAGALRSAFGGFHVAQFRDPLSQFGSCFRALQEFGQWMFLVIPLQELGLGGENPLYSIIPKPWRVPALPWPTDDRAQRWATMQKYVATIVSSAPGTLEKVFRWHLLSWFLNNLAAIIHSDFTLDIDRTFDDADYRKSVRGVFDSEIGAAPDFSDLTKFSRYYRFEGLDMARIGGEIVGLISAAQKNGRLEAALSSLCRTSPTISPDAAVKMLHTKLNAALTEMASTDEALSVSADDWQGMVQRHRPLWANPRLRGAMHRIYPVVFPFVQAARSISSML